MPQQMNAFAGFYCNEQLLLSKYIPEEAIKQTLFDYEVFFSSILKISFSINIDLPKPIDKENWNWNKDDTWLQWISSPPFTLIKVRLGGAMSFFIAG